MRSCFALAAIITALSVQAAPTAGDIARIHLEAIGGRERVEALGAMHASGTVMASGQAVSFRLWAARPDRLRIETEGRGRLRVQATDGIQPAWEFDSAARPATYRPMADGAARTFVSDAEFDDPLIATPDRKFTVDFAGEVEREGRKAFRLLVTRPGGEPFQVLVDAATFLIVERSEQRMSAVGRRVSILTRYGAFRPVAGVLLPHELVTSVDGRETQRTTLFHIEANPRVASDLFRRPAAALSLSREE